MIFLGTQTQWYGMIHLIEVCVEATKKMVSGEGRLFWPINHVIHLSSGDLLFTLPAMWIDSLIMWRLKMKVKFQSLGSKTRGNVLNMVSKIHLAEIQYRVILTCSFPVPSTSSSTLILISLHLRYIWSASTSTILILVQVILISDLSKIPSP